MANSLERIDLPYQLSDHGAYQPNKVIVLILSDSSYIATCILFLNLIKEKLL